MVDKDTDDVSDDEGKAFQMQNQNSFLKGLSNDDDYALRFRAVR